jgi:DNA primase catalytic subunit
MKEEVLGLHRQVDSKLTYTLLALGRVERRQVVRYVQYDV